MIACIDVMGHKFTNKRKSSFSQHLVGVYNIMLGNTFVTNITTMNYKCGCVRINYSSNFNFTLDAKSLLLINNVNY